MAIITADHGNVEEMINLETGKVDTEHSTNPVPFIVVSNQLIGKTMKLNQGILADITPTVLSLLEMKTPTEMSGRVLL
jgi:2,3-bisphosphoglycerate-independent phosphoglycerate mutase